MSGFEVSRRWGLLAVALLALSGCHRDWDGTRAAAGEPSGVETTAAGSAGLAQAGSGTVLRSGLPGPQPAVPGPRLSFAALPDRGDLVGYPQQRVVRHQGAYTWHRADVSEAHALRAIGGGVLRLTTPDGQLLAFEYERHVEHRSGDWTWVGRLLDAPPGRQAIITFGAEAVFGSIGQSAAAPPLRLTMRDGASWMVETDPALLAGVEGRVLRAERPDFLIPPAAVSGQGAPTTSADSASSSGSEIGTASATTSSSATVVDVLVGYTSGFATALGGTSAAVTRIHNLVDITNQAYINSQVDARVRLVHAMQVSYPDATDNGDTLEKLTGYKSGEGATTPDPAFNALRNARETYGADLVSLVRKFNTPENDGCGIAWLIGGGQSTISQSYERFGYSVVSDGQDQGTDGKTYFCREETLGHEFGHNMGSAHDVKTAEGDDGMLDPDDYGRYPYSFGYKTAPGSGDFFTIMAYSDKRDAPPYQQSYRVFSNPRTTFCGGFACGTSGADNARSLGQTIPIIATFRATIIPVSSNPRIVLKELDTNGNGTSDLLLRSRSLNRFTIWYMMGTTRIAYSGTNLSGVYALVGTGDFNGDHRTDLLWTSQARDIVISLSGGSGYTNVVTPYVYDAGTKIASVADINGNGKADILVLNAATGRLVVWYMDGTTRVAYNAHSIPISYEFVGSGDLNKDGKQDLVWTSAQRDVLVSMSTGISFSSSFLAHNYSADYEIAGTSDVNGNGRSDLVFRSEALGKIAIWFMDGTTRVAYSGKTLSSKYRLVGKGDFNGDRRGDLVWVDGVGNVLFSLSTGTNFSDSLLPYTYPSDYLMMDVM